jgi:hypothetical protein
MAAVRHDRAAGRVLVSILNGTLGAAVTSYRIEQSLIDTMVLWSETFIANQERIQGLSARTIPVPERGQFTTVSETFQKWPENATPAILVLAPGLAGQPRVEADRTLTASVAIGIGIITTSTVPGGARETAHIIGAAYRQLLLRVKPIGLSGYFDGMRYIDERYNDMPGTDERNKASARLVFTMNIRRWADARGRPIDMDRPPENPYDPPEGWPTVGGEDKLNFQLTPTDRIEET